MPKVIKTNRQKKKTIQGVYCRKCQKHLSSNNFYEATNPILDKNGFQSICKNCCQEIYNEYFKIYGNMKDAMYNTCRDLDIRFDEDVLKQCQSQIETLLSKNKKADKVFGYYKSKLGSTGKANSQIESLRFKDSHIEKQLHGGIENITDDEKIDEKLKLFWGEGFTSEDYKFLEMELAEWEKTYKHDNQAHITLLREICIQTLVIRKKRKNGEDVKKDQDELQALMKTADVDPSSTSMANAGKSQQAYGVWIKDIEQYRPAEWFDKQDKYKDMDGFIPYIKNYILRPIKNFITGSRDFHVDDDVMIDLDNDGDK